jgi:hypothetical protein
MLHMLQWLYMYVTSICSKCFICFFRRMLQASVSNVSSAFSDVCCKCTYLDVAYVSHICCKSIFEMFQLFQSYVAINIFMLLVANILYDCCICFTHILQVCSKCYICFRCTLHSSILCVVFCVFSDICSESYEGAQPDAGEGTPRAGDRRMGCATRLV